MKRLSLGLALSMFCHFTAVCQADDSFYKQPPLFSTAPSEKGSLNVIEHFGPVGISIELHQPAFVMKIKGLEKGSPAEATGQLKPGQIIETINGRKLADIDPRIQLGDIIAAAEAQDGAIELLVKDTPEAAARSVVVRLPVLGAYSKTWPLQCPKSDKIVRNFADYLARPDSDHGFSDIGMLFLLSTGEEKDVETVRQWAHSRADKPAPTYAWHLGYAGIPLAEYYLRTGDAAVLPTIQKWVDSAAKGEYLDAWAGRGGVVNIGYGNGHLNAGGTAVVTFLLLAKECGANVNESLLRRTLVHFFRFAGRGHNPYGDDRPERSLVDNGKTGNLAFAMAAAVSLTPRGEKSIYAAARDTCAMTSFYTTTYMLHGHTGGGIGEIWRSAAMGLLYEKKPAQYREFMDGRRWHYEMSRRFDGSFAILGGAGYDNTSWGAGYALTYTIPRKTLRITGAPSKFAKPHELPERPWGTAADDAFLSLEAAADKEGKRQDLSTETLQADSGKPLIERLVALGDVGDDILRRYVHHQDYIVRQLAASNAMGLKFHYMFPTAGDRVRIDLVLEFAASPDPRVRNSAFRALAARFDDKAPWAQRAFDVALARLADPAESWWVKDGALEVIGRGTPEMIAPHVDEITPYLRHQEQWLQNAAFTALIPVAADKRCYQKVLPPIGDLLRVCQRHSTTGGPLGGLRGQLSGASGDVQKLARETLQGVFAGYAGVKKWEGGQDVTTVYDQHLEILAMSLASVPGGYDVLYEVAKARAPSDPLPYDEIFLEADPEKFGPALKQAMAPIIRDQLIDEYVDKNRVKLLAEAAVTKQNAVVTNPALRGLVDLYQKIGVRDYDWRPFGPDLMNAPWDYHMFDPAEQMKYDISPWRYRPVTYPPGMENWFATDFNAAQAGWKKGQAPFGQYNGKLVTDAKPCEIPDCHHTDPMRTLWDKEVLLVRGTFQFPPLKPGHIYRVCVGTGQHVGSGDGYTIYLNGKPLVEAKEGIGRRAGNNPRGAFITKDVVDEFGNGPVTLAATTFLRYGSRAIVTMPPVPQGIFSMWVEEMKLPPLDELQRK